MNKDSSAMTDSNKPPSREEFKRLKEAVAAQSEIIENYLPDDPQKRKFLGEAAKGLGAVGALGIAGQSGYSVGKASAEASTSDADVDIGSPNNRHDAFLEGVDANSVNADRVFSESLPTLVRIFLNGNNDAVALSRDTNSVIDSGTNHAAVIQSAIDHVDNLIGTPDYKRQRIYGWIDGGTYEYDVTQNITTVGQIGLRDFKLGAGGATGFVPLTVTDTPGTQEATFLDNVAVHDSGDSDGMVFDGAFVRCRDVEAFGNGGNGILIKNVAGLWMDGVKTRHNGVDGVKMEDDSTGAPTFVRLRNGDFSVNGGRGVHLDTPGSSGDDIEDVVIKDCNFGGNTSQAFAAKHNVNGLDLRDNWFEGTGADIVLGFGADDSTNIHIVENRLGSSIDIQTCTSTFIRENYAHWNGSFDLTVSSSATDTLVEYNDLNGGAYSDSGTNTIRNTF